MKLSNTVVSVIVIAAVLVSAYAMGLLIRQVRTGGHVAQPPSAGNEAPAGAKVPHGPGEARTKDTPQERTQLKEEKAQAIEKMSSLTEEQKEKFRSQVRQQVGGQRPSKGRQDLPPPQRQAPRIKVQSPSETAGQKEDVNAPAARGESTNTKPSDKAGSAPGQAGPG
jgi:hypothetical protein